MHHIKGYASRGYGLYRRICIIQEDMYHISEYNPHPFILENLQYLLSPKGHVGLPGGPEHLHHTVGGFNLEQHKQGSSVAQSVAAHVTKLGRKFSPSFEDCNQIAIYIEMNILLVSRIPTGGGFKYICRQRLLS